jgi:hypothetical protein
MNFPILSTLLTLSAMILGSIHLLGSVYQRLLNYFLKAARMIEY